VATLVHAFVTSHMDYCNAILVGMLKSITNKLQQVLNAAVHIVGDTHKYDCGLSHHLDDDDLMLIKSYKANSVTFKTVC